MKTYRYNEYISEGEYGIVEMTEDQILDEYFLEWLSGMRNKYDVWEGHGQDNAVWIILYGMCIEDWVASHWAWEARDTSVARDAQRQQKEQQ